MPAIDFEIIGVEAVRRAMAPMLHFNLRATSSGTENIHGALLHAQIQIQPAQRRYSAPEKEGLEELFGTPERWGQTLRNRLWTHADTTLPSFTGVADGILPVPCTYDLNIAASKYFHALEGGDVSLLFLFSGTIFYGGADGRLQAERISWNKECVFRMPANLWRELMDQHYPNSAWICLGRDAFERLGEFKSRNRLADWEQVIERLLPAMENELQETV